MKPFVLPASLLLFCLSHCLPIAAISATPTATPPAETYPLFREVVQDVQSGRLDEAMLGLEKIDAIQPDLCDTLILRASIYLKKKDPASAKGFLDKAESLYPGLPTHTFNRAEWHFVAGDYPAARQLFAQIKPDSAQATLASYKIFLCDLMTHQDQGGREALERQSADPKNPLYHYTHAAFLFRHGQAEQGREELQAAYRIYPPATNELYAESLLTLGFIRSEDLPLKDMGLAAAEAKAGLAIPKFDLAVKSVMDYAAQVPPGARLPETDLPGSGAALVTNEASAQLPGLDSGKKAAPDAKKSE
jgi:tetratricopeptide (TPR) repeat protein